MTNTYHLYVSAKEALRVLKKIDIGKHQRGCSCAACALESSINKYHEDHENNSKRLKEAGRKGSKKN